VETQKRQNTYYLESLFTEGPGNIEVVFYLSAATSKQISGQCDSHAESKGIIHFSDVTLLFERWIIFKNLQFILLNI